MEAARARPCNVEPRRAMLFRLARRGRRKLPIVRLGGGGGSSGAGCRGRVLLGVALRRLRFRWLSAWWLHRAGRRLAELYVAALSGIPAVPGGPRCPPWIGVEPCFATPFVPAVSGGPAVMKRWKGQDQLAAAETFQF